jgi:predicted dehydrogenase
MKRGTRDSTATEAPFARRNFLGGALAAMGSAALLKSASISAEEKPAPVEFKRKVKLGIVGCGQRGSWIAKLFQQHGGYDLHAVADYFQDAADAGGNPLGVEKARRFSGLSGYKKLLDSGVEAVVLINVPCFHAEQSKAAVEAGVHVYMAKPVAVDVPGCLAIGAAAKQATQKQRCFLVDYQLPTEQPNIEVATRIREGALGRLAHIVSFGFSGAWSDPPKGPTIEDRLRGEIWLSDIALGGDNIVSYDIHIIDGITWVMGKRPVSAVGKSRICRPDPHGDRCDCGGVVYEYDDGVIWTHLVQAMNNNADLTTMSAGFFGASAMARIQYGGKVFVRGGPKHYAGQCGSIYDDGAKRNIAEFYRSITEGHFENPTAQRAVDGTLTAILGREASARRRFLTMEELLKENKRLEVDLKGLKA